MNETGKAVRDWWRTYLRPEHHPQIQEDSSAARALRARLRRSVSPLEILSEPAVHQLAQDLPFLRRRPHDLARLASTLAAVKADNGRRLAAVLGQVTEGDRPRMSDLRFQRLIRSADAEFGPALRRALTLADGACDVAALAGDMLAWSDPDRGERVRIGWCFDYFGAAQPDRAGGTTQQDATE